MKIVTVNNTDLNLRIEGEFDTDKNSLTVTVNQIEDFELMNFGAALEELKEGFSLTRMSWHNEASGSCVFMDDTGDRPVLRLRYSESDMKPIYIASSDDILADDWIIDDAD